jgi:hypothetical protein
MGRTCALRAAAARRSNLLSQPAALPKRSLRTISYHRTRLRLAFCDSAAIALAAWRCSSRSAAPHPWKAISPPISALARPRNRHRRVLGRYGRGRRNTPPALRRTTAAGSGVATYTPITSSALTISVCGIVRPSALAVLRLRTNLNLVGCSTGRSAGFAPFSILSV